MSRLLKRIKSFDWRLELLKIGFGHGVGARVIVDAVQEIDGQVKLRQLLGQIRGQYRIPQQAHAGSRFGTSGFDLFA